MTSAWRKKQRFFVFLRCAPGQTYNVAARIAGGTRETFCEVYSVTGEWDLVLRTEFDSHRNFGEVIAELVTDVDGIEETHSVAAYPIWDPEDIFF